MSTLQHKDTYTLCGGLTNGQHFGMYLLDSNQNVVACSLGSDLQNNAWTESRGEAPDDAFPFSTWKDDPASSLREHWKQCRTSDFDVYCSADEFLQKTLCAHLDGLHIEMNGDAFIVSARGASATAPVQKTQRQYPKVNKNRIDVWI